MSTEEEINDAVNAMLEVNNHQLIILHCISSYPAPPEKSNLNQIKIFLINLK